MKVSNGTSFDDVFKKWEKRGEERRLNAVENMANFSSGEIGSQSGRAAWQQRFDNSGLPRRRTSRKKHHRSRGIDSNDYFMMSEQVEKKFQLVCPTVENLYRSTRPAVAGCVKCSQKSKLISVKGSPLRNLLDLSVFSRKNFFRTAFSDFLYVAYLPTVNYSKKNGETRTAVAKSSGVCATMQRLATSEENVSTTCDLKGMIAETPTLKEMKNEARQIINGMNGTIKGYLIRLATWVLYKFFGKILTSIHINQGQIAMLHEAAKRNIPLVYLPLHKSHLDYLFISFVLSWNGLKVPYIAVGDNLRNVPLFSWFMRNMGGFFVRKTIGGLNDPRNELYKAVLNEYVAQILISGNNLEIFIEDTRSRSGKSSPPKIGVLSSVVSAVIEGRVPDVLVIPISVSYEKILEAGFTDELLGEPKKAESLLQIVKNVWRIFKSSFGQVRVDFGMPLSILEMKRASEISESWQNFIKTASSNTKQLSVEGLGILKSNNSEISLESLNCSSIELTKGIARHVLFDCDQNSAIMGTHLVAFLLLTKFRKGVKLREFVNAFELLKKDILMRKRDYGFSGDNEDVIFHSIQLLGKDLVSWNPDSRIIEPTLSVPGVLKLSYYSNQVLSVFVLESIIACSIGALLADECISLSELIYHDATISRKELLNTALDLCDLLQKEFIFAPPCSLLETALIDAIESFIAADILNVCEDTSIKSREKKWVNNIAISTAWSDNEETDDEIGISDQEYKMNSSDEVIAKLKFFRDILSPMIESYWFAASRLLLLRDSMRSEQDLIDSIHTDAVSRVRTGTALFNESCSLATITNATKVFRESGMTCGPKDHSMEQSRTCKDIHFSAAYINRYKP